MYRGVVPFQHPLVHPDVVTAVCSYLLYLVSCHSDPVLVNAASNALIYHVENGAAFAPDRAQLLAIALNMGQSRYQRGPPLLSILRCGEIRVMLVTTTNNS